MLQGLEEGDYSNTTRIQRVSVPQCGWFCHMLLTQVIKSDDSLFYPLSTANEASLTKIDSNTYLWIQA